MHEPDVHTDKPVPAAHETAYKKCKYMHRDVSAGNLLIWPQFIRREDGKCGVLWRGLLADWEMATHSDTKKAMEPQRVVRLPITLTCVRF